MAAIEEGMREALRLWCHWTAVVSGREHNREPLGVIPNKNMSISQLQSCRFRSCNHTSRTQPTPLRFSREFVCTTLITPRYAQNTSGAPPIPRVPNLATSLLPLLLLSTQQTNSGKSTQAVCIGNECLPAGYAGDGHAHPAAGSAKYWYLKHRWVN